MKRDDSRKPELEGSNGVADGDSRPRGHEAGFYEAYKHFASTLRIWFVTYGIGAVALCVTTDGLVRALSLANVLRPVSVSFLLGVGVQVLQAVMYKTAMWYL